ncbi:MAG: hypothetical protein ATN32_03135 [Candidatus Epulonipiscium fishelsonii]|nr:MAG: hypothetical protein ATN32_03135 [Epulopiscium sp. AS2M-Bin002]
MIILFLCVNLILLILYLLSAKMINTHFNKINRCIKIYNDKKIYKSDKEVEFVTNLVRDFKQLSSVKRNDIEANIFVKNKIAKARIGIFEYNKVENLLIQLKWLMLVVFFSNVIYNYLTSNNKLFLGIETDKFILCINGIILFATFTSYILLNVKYKKNQVILTLEDYLVNQYDYEVIKLEEELKIRKLNKEISLLKDQLKNNNNEKTKEKIKEKSKEIEAATISEEKSDYAHLTDDEIIQLLKQMVW